MSINSYREKVLEWRNDREVSIRRENGWLALCGLFWMKLGRNRFGSDPACEVNLPKRAPAEVGLLDFNGKSVTLEVNPGNTVKLNGKLTGFAILQPDTSDSPSYITLDDICLVVIQRSARTGIRLWDNQRVERSEYPPRTWYEINEAFRFSAVYTPYDQPKMVFFPDLSDEATELPVHGNITFDHNGRQYGLEATQEDDRSLFIRFWDPGSNTIAYPTGRYLIAEPDKDGRLVLDFNFAYNPPCAFTEFATCVFAPEQNHLDFIVRAGEIYPRHD